MKNLLKMGMLGVVIAGTVAACDPPKSSSTKDPGDTVHKAPDSNKAAIDTAKKDTTKK